MERSKICVIRRKTHPLMGLRQEKEILFNHCPLSPTSDLSLTFFHVIKCDRQRNYSISK